MGSIYYCFNHSIIHDIPAPHWLNEFPSRFYDLSEPDEVAQMVHTKLLFETILNDHCSSANW